MPVSTKAVSRQSAQFPRREPVQPRAQQRVQMILDAAAEVLQETGYARASTNRIARQAGVSIGSLYQYFSGKEDLVAALMERQAEAELELLTTRLDALRDRPVAEVTAAIVQALFEIHKTNPELHRVINEEVPRSELIGNGHAVDVEATKLIREYLARHADELVVDDLDLAAFIVLHTIETLIHQAANYRRELLLDARLPEEATTMVLRYLTGS